MDWIEYLKLIGITSIPGVLLILAVILIGKKIIEKYFESSIEKYKNDIALLSRKNAYVFEKIHEKKIEAISETYSKLNLLYKSLSFLTSQLKSVPKEKSFEELENELIADFSEQYNQFVDSFLVNRLFLSKESCENVERILKEFRVASGQYNAIRLYRKSGVTGEHYANAFKESVAASKRVENDFPKALDELKESLNSEIEKFEINR